MEQKPRLKEEVIVYFFILKEEGLGVETTLNERKW